MARNNQKKIFADCISPRKRIPIFFAIAVSLMGLFCLPSSTCSFAANSNPDEPENEISIAHLEPDDRGGKAYKLVYLVKVPIDVYWKFKTDFDNRFLVTNKYIREHHFISRSDNTVITENKYTNAPDVFFRWRHLRVSGGISYGFCSLEPARMRRKFPLRAHSAGGCKRRHPGDPDRVFRLLGCFAVGL